jgi:hypothetical protein
MPSAISSLLKGNVKRDLILAGTTGLLIGAGIYAGACALSARIPILFPSPISVTISFALLLLLALIEIPMMVFGLRQIARSCATPRRLLLATFGFYVAFASVYASACVMLTGQIALGLGIVALCLVRLVSGIWVK